MSARDRRPRAVADATITVVDGEALVHRAGELHLLDPVATVVWRCCDGELTVEGLAAELAEVFDADPGTVRHDVLEVVERLGAIGLLEPDEPVLDPSLGTPLEVLADEPGSCAACESGPGYPLVSSYAVGRFLVAVGTADADVDAAIRVALGAHLVGADVTGRPPFYGLTLPAALPAEGPQPLHVLQRGDTVATASRDPRRVIGALLAHLGCYADLDAYGLVAVPALVAVRGTGAVLVPVPEPGATRRVEHTLTREGFTVADMPFALVDPDAAEVVVGAVGIDFDPAPLDALAATRPSREDPGAAPWGRLAVEAVAVPEGHTPSDALLALAPPVDGRHDPARTLDGLAALLGRVPVVAATTGGLTPALEAVRS